jgi:apolipoprotein N-acyltransferase
MEMTLQPPATPLVTASGPPRPIRARLALPMAILSGAALLLSFPPYGLWWLAPVGVALLAAATHRRRLRRAFLFGWVAGLVLFVPLLNWTTIGAGWVPWILLSVAEGAFLGLLGVAGAWLSPAPGCRRCWTAGPRCGR